MSSHGADASARPDWDAVLVDIVDYVRGFIEEGTTTTPFDMAVLNELDRFHLAIEAVERLPALKGKGAEIVAALQESLVLHKAYIQEHGKDMPDISEWKWPYPRSGISAS